MFDRDFDESPTTTPGPALRSGLAKPHGPGKETAPVETGWLLDDGVLCIGGAPNHGLALVTYDAACAIRFARKQDAEAFARVLYGIGFNALAATVKAVEHQWS